MALRAKRSKLIDSQFSDLPDILEDKEIAKWLTSEKNIDRIESQYKSKTKSYLRALIIMIICDLVFIVVTKNPDLKFTILGLNIFKFKGINEILIALSTFAFFEFVIGLIGAISLNRFAAGLIEKAFNKTNSFYVHASLGRTDWSENIFLGRQLQQRPIHCRIIYQASIVSMSLMLIMILLLQGYAIYTMAKEIVSSQVLDSTFIVLIIATSTIINLTALAMFVFSLMIKFKTK